MFKLNKILIKRGFKSIINSKVFSILMMILILITGSVFTTLSSSANAFNSSYKTIIKNGNLHDYVIKSNFVNSSSELDNSKIEFKVIDHNNQDQAYNSSTNWLNVLNKTNNQRKSIIKIKIASVTNSYAKYQDKIKFLTVDNSIINQPNLILDAVENYISQWKEEIKRELRENLTQEFVEDIRNDYHDKMFVKSTSSLYVEKSKKSYKIVEYQKPLKNDDNEDIQKVNTLIRYDGFADFTKELTDKEFANQLKYQVLSKNLDWNNFQVQKQKEYKQIAVEINGLGNNTFTITDPSAYQAIVSPAFANQNNKRAISPYKLASLFSEDPYFMDKLQKDQNLQIKYEDSLIYASDTPYFITGIGTTPDFMYPILDASKPIVDSNSQAVLFVNKRGYKRIYDAFRSNPTENYVSIRFKKDVSSDEKKEIIKDIRLNLEGSKQKGQSVLYPKNVFARMKGVDVITTYDDPNDQILLTQERVSTLDKISSTVSTLSFITTTLLVLFLLLISIMIFKTLISGSRKVYGTLHALGYTKVQIAMSNALTAIIIAVVPMAISYAIGYGAQFVFMNNFSSAWTIPAYANAFSWITLLVMVIIPTIIYYSIIFFTTLYEMKSKLPDMLNGKHSNKINNLIVRSLSKFNLLGVKTKYVFALSAKNIGKLSLIIISSIIALTSIMVGMGTIGRANQAYNATIKMNDYEFAVSLVTPTKEGGEYEALRPLDANKEDVKVPSLLSQKKSSSNAAWYRPSASDSNYALASNAANNIQKSAVFLKNKLQHKLVLKFGTIGKIDPWDIAQRLMPDNQKNQANKDTESIIKKVFAANTNPNYKSLAEQKLIKDEFKNLLTDKGNTPYVISYNKVLINKDDELYTHINGLLTKKKEQFVIKGIKSNSKMVNVKSSDIANIKKLWNKNKSAIPILINKYIAAHLNLKIGNILDYQITNIVDNSNFPKKIKIAGIIDGYNNLGVYTTKAIANETLGMTSQGFNGLFTKSSNPKVLATLPLYSKSGIYPATDSLTRDWSKFLTNYLNSSDWINKQVKDSEGNIIRKNDQFLQKYSETPYASIIKRVRWSAIDKNTFRNVTKLSSSIINIIEAISIVLSILFTLIVSILMFRINRKKISALWAMGYRKREISKMFLSVYILPMVLSIFISIPIAYAMLSVIKIFVMNFGQILIPLAITWWIPIVALIAIAAIFVFSTITTIYSQSATVALDAFKGD